VYNCSSRTDRLLCRCCCCAFSCHCAELDPNAVIDNLFNHYGKPSPNRQWKMNHQPDATPGPVNCAGKTAFDIKGIYGDVATVRAFANVLALAILPLRVAVVVC
jgi:hypothetical protein